MPSAEEHQQQFRNLNRKVNILLVLLTVVGLGAVGVCSAAQSNDLENLSDEATARLAKSQIDSLMANPAYTEYSRGDRLRRFSRCVYGEPGIP